MGHFAKYCRFENKLEEITNLALEANEGFLLMAQNEINTNNDYLWYLDSGERNHMCGNKHLFKEMQKIEDCHVSFGDASKVKVEGKGMICYLQKDDMTGSIQYVYYVLVIPQFLTLRSYIICISIINQDHNLEVSFFFSYAHSISEGN